MIKHKAVAIPFSLAPCLARYRLLLLFVKKIHTNFLFPYCCLPIRMQFSSIRLVLLALLLMPAIAAQRSDAQKHATFPPISSYSLDKARVNLPGDFAGKLNLLLISFQPEQQKDIDSWMPAAQGLLHTTLGFRWYRLPVSGPENVIFRWWENSSMRSDESDPETWPWTIPLYINKDPFRRDLQISDEKNIVVLLTDKQGRVLWRVSGAMTAANRSALNAAVAEALASHP
jgi:hypothetical protein